MLDYIYQWIQNLTFYLVLVTVVVQTIPNNGYKKYIRFFTGLILILMLAEPVFGVVGMKHTFWELYQNTKYEQEIKAMKEATAYLEGVSLETVEGMETDGKIYVEEIRIEDETGLEEE